MWSTSVPTTYVQCILDVNNGKQTPSLDMQPATNLFQPQQNNVFQFVINTLYLYIHYALLSTRPVQILKLL